MARSIRSAHHRSPIIKRLLGFSAWPPIAFSDDTATGIESDFQYFVDRIETCQVIECMSKQELLVLPGALMTVGEVEADETRVHLFASDQRYEVRGVPRHQNPIPVDRALYVLPIFGPAAANSPDMSAFESGIPCELREVGTQSLVDQELH